MKNIFILFFILVFFAGNIKAGNENWSVFDMNNSILPDNDIKSLRIDSKGTLWIGTYAGLLKYDGSDWKLYSSTNSQLPSDLINIVLFDNNDNTWIGTLDGLAKFDGTNWTVYNTANSGLSSNMVYNFKIDKQNNIWIEKTGETGHGLIKYDGTNWQNFSSAVENAFATCMEIDKNGNIVVGTNKGVLIFDGAEWTQLSKSNSELPDNLVMSLAIDSANNYWIGTYGGGLAKYDGNSWTIFNTNNSGLKDNIIEAICIDSQNNKWIGTMNEGLAKFDNLSWEIYDTLNSGLSDNYINDITIDNSDNIIIGTVSGGISIYKSKPNNINDNSYNNQNKVEIFPNPSRDNIRLTINNGNLSCLSKVIITNCSGVEVKAILNQESCNYFDIAVGHLPPGVYFFQLLDNNGNCTTDGNFTVLR